MTVFVVGLTGWWSNLFSFFRRPIDLPLAIVREQLPNARIYSGHWRKHKEFARKIILDWKEGDTVICLGHSYGSSAMTHLITRLNEVNIDVELFISEDQGADSWVIKDVPVTRNVEIVDEYLVAFERLGFVSDWKGVHNFTKLRGMHTATFTEPSIVKMMAARIVKIAKE